jgi:hypothetical protein
MTGEILLAWQAGFFDGEGCVELRAHRYNKTATSAVTTGQGRFGPKTVRGSSYTIGSCITQKEREPLVSFRDEYGGLLYDYQVKGITYWRWVITTDSAVRFLEAILPYCILKAPRIRLAVEFHKKMKVWNAEYGRRGYPDFVLEERERYFLEMKALNKRGVSASNPDPKSSGPGKGAKDVISAKMAQKKETGIVQ